MTNLRYLRLKYDIVLKDLERRTGLSNQYLSMLEFQTRKPSISVANKIQQAIEDIISERTCALSFFKQEYSAHKESLFAQIKEDTP